MAPSGANVNRRQFVAGGALGLARLAGISLLQASLARQFLFADQEPAGSPISRPPAKGPLQILKANPRYFTDGSGRAIYLAGCHTWWDFEDSGLRLLSARDQDPPPVFDFEGYLRFLVAHDHNFFRLWRWEAPKWGEDQPRGAIKFCQPHPWVRSGPGLARDGKPKFDLTRFNQPYFDRMRDRVKAAGDRGIYVSIMLFEGHELENFTAWPFHPFEGANNINGIDPEPCPGCDEIAHDDLRVPASAGEDLEGLKTGHFGGATYVGKGLALNTLQQSPMGKRVLALQQAYLRKVIDTVNDLENVLYEVCNEAGGYSTAWQYHVIDFVKQVESGKAQQHPIGMTFQSRGGTNENLYRSPADWIAPNPGSADENFLDDPSSTYHGKVIVDDTDHLCGHTCGDALWVWKSFCHGLNVLMMEDLSASPVWQDSARVAMGQTRRFSQRIDLAHMTPDDSLSETRYCLANKGKEYLVFQPGNKGEFVVNLSDVSGEVSVEWFNVTTGATVIGKNVKAGGPRTFPTPFGGPAALYLKASSRNS
jgi:hypothetical protein